MGGTSPCIAPAHAMDLDQALLFLDAASDDDLRLLNSAINDAERGTQQFEAGTVTLSAVEDHFASLEALTCSMASNQATGSANNQPHVDRGASHVGRAPVAATATSTGSFDGNATSSANDDKPALDADVAKLMRLLNHVSLEEVVTAMQTILNSLGAHRPGSQAPCCGEAAPP